MGHDETVSLSIETTAGGMATLRIVVERGGDLVERPVTGPEPEVRELARRLAGTADLMPLWNDASWIKGRGCRPAAPRYERRR